MELARVQQEIGEWERSRLNLILIYVYRSLQCSVKIVSGGRDYHDGHDVGWRDGHPAKTKPPMTSPAEPNVVIGFSPPPPPLLFPFPLSSSRELFTIVGFLFLSSFWPLASRCSYFRLFLVSCIAACRNLSFPAHVSNRVNYP